MRKSKTKKPVRKKSTTSKTGRPRSTGSGSAIMVRVHKPQLKAIDLWIADSGLSRPEAIRQLVNFALAHVKPQEEPAEEVPLNLVRRARENELRREPSS